MTQSPTISRTACICCVAACTQWNFKLKKKNKNQIMKFYTQGDVKSCSHFGKKKIWEFLKQLNAVTTQRLNIQMETNWKRP